MTETNPSVDKRLCSTSQKSFQYVSKSFWKRVNKNSLTWYMSWKRLKDIFKTFWISLEDVLKTFFQDVLKTFSRRFEDVLTRPLEDVLKTSWKRLGKTSWRRFEDVLKRLEDILKMYDQDYHVGLDLDILKMSWRRLLKTYEFWW